jgi:hypothetical protein
MREREFRFLREHESASQIVIYIVKRIHAEDVTRPTAHHEILGNLDFMTRHAARLVVRPGVTSLSNKRRSLDRSLISVCFKDFWSHCQCPGPPRRLVTPE